MSDTDRVRRDKGLTLMVRPGTVQHRPNRWKGRPMIRLIAALPLLCVLTACEDIVLPSGDPEADSAARGVRSCERAVRAETGNDAAAHDPSAPVVEVNIFIIAVPGAESWRCLTDDAGRAQQIVKVRG